MQIAHGCVGEVHVQPVRGVLPIAIQEVLQHKDEVHVDSNMCNTPPSQTPSARDMDYSRTNFSSAAADKGTLLLVANLFRPECQLC